MPAARDGQTDAAQPTDSVRRELPKVDVVQLLQGSNEACLIFRDSEYRLRITRQGKLLLTK